jgi:hypothetical protein
MKASVNKTSASTSSVSRPSPPIASVNRPTVPEGIDPLIGQMVAFFADQEDWMETEPKVSKNGKVSKHCLYEQARGHFMFGRIHKAKIKSGDQQKDKKYEVRWTLTGFQSSKYIHRLTLSQVQRGIENYELSRGNG